MERLFILHLNRSGGTRLSQSLSEVLKLKHYPSPFRDVIRNHPQEFSFYFNNPCLLQERIINETEERLRELMEGFNKVILLTRRDLKGAIESWAYVSYFRRNRDVYFQSHTSKYIWKRTPNYERIEQLLTDADQTLKRIALDYNIPITYYEDLFYNSPVETVKSFDLDINAEKFVKDYLNTDLRQRKYNSGYFF